MAAEELATQRLGERLQSSRWGWCKGESCRGSSKFLERPCCWGGKADYARRSQRGVD